MTTQCTKVCEALALKAELDKLREAARLALEALQRGETKLRWEAIAALQEALK